MMKFNLQYATSEVKRHYLIWELSLVTSDQLTYTIFYFLNTAFFYELKENILDPFFKYAEYKPNTNYNTLNQNTWTLPHGKME
jgi:hypothetical protein